LAEKRVLFLNTIYYPCKVPFSDVAFNKNIMIVYKFGGASVSSASAIRKLAGIVSPAGNELVIVISAFGKTTNALEALLTSWYENNVERFVVFDQIKNYHYNILADLIPSTGHPVYKELEELAGIIESKLGSVPSDYNFEYDQVVSFGELASTKIVSAFLNSIHLDNIWIDARKWLRTDNVYREANVDFAGSGMAIGEIIPPGRKGIWITQGFIGGGGDGSTTTLGREGSDYTAAIVSNLLNARELVVWKDVPGILTADPAFFPEAEKIDELSYQEAIELSFYGAKIIHPKTIKPLQNKAIPLFVKSFAEPDGEGTLIHNTDAYIMKPVLIIKKEQMLVSLTPRDFSFIVEDYLGRIFSLFFKFRIKVNLIQHSAISFTICMDNKGRNVQNLLAEMKADFRVLYNEDLELITIRHYTPEVIEKYTGGRKVLIEQRSRSTAMFALI
jgi:aspartate kinase